MCLFVCVSFMLFFLFIRSPPCPTLTDTRFPYTTLCRSAGASGLKLHAVRLVRIAHCLLDLADHARMHVALPPWLRDPAPYYVSPVGSLPVDRKSTRLNSSH